MQLYYSPASPYVRKVCVVLHEVGQFDAVELLHPLPNPADTSHVEAANPLGKLPTLVRPDGPALYDSRVICRYLDTTFNGGLYPDGQLWDVLTLEATADGILDAALLMVYEGRFRPEDMVYAPWVDRQWGKVARALDVLETRWMSHLAGPLHMGQIAVGCALGYLDLRHGDRDWRAGRPALAAWSASFGERASMAATVPAA
ncbi:MAG: glutathione S-transferase [Pseudomonadota bacterium]